MTSRKLLAALACAVLSMAALAACGSSGDSTTSSSTGTAPTADTATSSPAGEPIVVGTIGSFSGPLSGPQLYGQIPKTIEAWVQATNAAGGINGHPVKVIVKDDAGDNAKALQAAKELVEQDHVMAIVGNPGTQDAAWVPYTSKKGIPIVGGNPVNATMTTDPHSFPIGAGAGQLALAQGEIAKSINVPNIGVTECAEAPICAQLPPLMEAVAGIVGGIEVIEGGKIASTQPNFIANCLSLKKKGAASLFLGLPADTVVKMQEECVRQGYQVPLIQQGTVVSPSWLAAKSLGEVHLATPTAVGFEEGNPAIAKFDEAIEKYAPGLLQQPNFTLTQINAWMGGELFKAAAEAASIGPDSTPADVENGLYSLKDETLGGLSVPLNYVKGKPTWVDCYFSQTIEGGKLVTENGGKPVCPPISETEAFLKALKITNVSIASQGS